MLLFLEIFVLDHDAVVFIVNFDKVETFVCAQSKESLLSCFCDGENVTLEIFTLKLFLAFYLEILHVDYR